jgi:hypothetical protein
MDATGRRPRANKRPLPAACQWMWVVVFKTPPRSPGRSR